MEGSLDGNGGGFGDGPGAFPLGTTALERSGPVTEGVGCSDDLPSVLRLRRYEEDLRGDDTTAELVDDLGSADPLGAVTAEGWRGELIVEVVVRPV